MAGPLFASVFVCDGGIESAMRNDLREETGCGKCERAGLRAARRLFERVSCAEGTVLRRYRPRGGH